jgi:hypothetical protein
MTLPASGAISIDMLRTEFSQWAAYTDMASFGTLVFGRPAGSQVLLSEFYGLSNGSTPGAETTYLVGIGAAPFSDWWIDGGVTFATAWGNVRVALGNYTDVGITGAQISFAYQENPTAWAHFSRVILPGGAVIPKASFTPITGTGGAPNQMFYMHGAVVAAGNLQFIYTN